jgi:HD-GYP domain-containing protein (c-di-GMP phosphodiesterase class II)
MNRDEIIEELKNCSGTQFDPKIVRYMIDMVMDGYVNIVKTEVAKDDENFKK